MFDYAPGLTATSSTMAQHASTCTAARYVGCANILRVSLGDEQPTLVSEREEMKMPKYVVTGYVAGSAFLGEFEAATASDAYDLAMRDAHIISMCHQCSGSVSDLEVSGGCAENIEDLNDSYTVEP